MNPADCISTKRFGDVEATVLRTALLQWGPVFPDGQDWWTPDVPLDDRGRAIIDVQGLLVKTPEAVVVVDPAGYHSEADIPSFLDLTLQVLCDTTDALAAAGVHPDEVTHVLMTHGHGDHFNGALDGTKVRFPNARHVFPPADWSDEVHESLDPVQEMGLLDLVEGDLEVTPGISYLHAPGESPGHHVVRAGPVWYLGDLFHFVTEVEHLDWWPEQVTDPELVEPSRRRILEQAEGDTLVFAHGVFPPWGRAEQVDGAWRWRYER
jgi:glyoxylase-like metal-dependent hydrolase (beta-lactamase superfamily II)